jgi:hypothetical protein
MRAAAPQTISAGQLVAVPSVAIVPPATIAIVYLLGSAAKLWYAVTGAFTLVTGQVR